MEKMSGHRSYNRVAEQGVDVKSPESLSSAVPNQPCIVCLAYSHLPWLPTHFVSTPPTLRRWLGPANTTFRGNLMSQC